MNSCCLTDTEVLRNAIMRSAQLRDEGKLLVEQALLDLIRGKIATAVALTSPDLLEIDRPFYEIGIDSFMALEICNGLASDTGLKLSATLLFNHDTPAALSKYLTALLTEQVDVQQPALSTSATPQAIL